jgi:hypothetical protein
MEEAIAAEPEGGEDPPEGAKPSKVEPAKPEPEEEKEEPETVSLKKEEYEDMKAAASAFRAQQQARKAELVALVHKAAEDAYTTEDLQSLDVAALEKLAKALKVNEPIRSYAGARAVPGGEDAGYPEPPDPYDLAGLAKARQGGAN